MAEEKTEKFVDDRDDRHKVYGLPNANRMQFDKSSIWVPVVIGMSVAAGVLTTRGIQRLMRGTGKTMSRTASNTESSTVSSSGSSFELPQNAQTRLSAKTFTGFVPHSGDFREPMDVGEAGLILGCRETASKEVINKRFNALMKCNHPDKGGSPFVASKINEAKTVLLKGGK